VPAERVRDDDRRCELDRPPVRREVDDRGRQLVVEEDVAGQVAVDQLTRRVDRLERGEHVVELGKVGLAPRDAVADSPWVGSRIDDRAWTRHMRERRVKALTDGDDLAPAPLFVHPGHVLGRGPAVHDLRPGPGEPEPVVPDRREDLRLPCDLVRSPVERLEHQVAHTPRPTGSAGQELGLAGNAEDLKNVCARSLKCHNRTGWTSIA
jgi:hypothetical protein